jgi:Mitochondrial ribosomal protein subunit L20
MGPQVNKLDQMHIPREYDKRVKLDDDDRAKIIKLRGEDKIKWSYNALAIEFGVSKALVILICRPDIAKKKKAQYHERRKDQRYYDKDKHREYMRRHRAWKRVVGVEV